MFRVTNRARSPVTRPVTWRGGHTKEAKSVSVHDASAHPLSASVPRQSDKDGDTAQKRSAGREKGDDVLEPGASTSGVQSVLVKARQLVEYSSSEPKCAEAAPS